MITSALQEAIEYLRNRCREEGRVSLPRAMAVYLLQSENPDMECVTLTHFTPHADSVHFHAKEVRHPVPLSALAENDVIRIAGVMDSSSGVATSLPPFSLDLAMIPPPDIVGASLHSVIRGGRRA